MGAFAIAPLLIWALSGAAGSRFSSLYSAFTSIGQLLALAGICLFASNLFMNARIVGTENYFGSLDRMYRVHHIVGAVAFIFLLFHPVFLSLSYLLISLQAAARFFVPMSNVAVLFGVIALGAMELLLIITFYIKVRYNTWKSTHKYLGLAFIAACIHILLITSDVSRNYALRSYIYSVMLVGVGSYLYKPILAKYTVKNLDYAVENVKQLNHDICQVTLKPSSSCIKHLPGQYLFVTFTSTALPHESHPFTISSSPSEKNIRLSIKAIGDFTSKIPHLRNGDIAQLDGPHGEFTSANYPASAQIWIAGGIGITPFLSMARSLGGKPTVSLYYSVKTDADAVFKEELIAISKKRKNFRVHINISSKDGHLDAVAIANSEPDMGKREMFICGPPGMMRTLKKQFIASGIKKQKIHTEEFSL